MVQVLCQIAYVSNKGELKHIIMCCILDSLAEKHRLLWSCLVLTGSTFSNLASLGLSYGILGSLTIALSQRFDISTNESSWTGAVHMAMFLSMCK